jgi:hypothetical protein
MRLEVAPKDQLKLLPSLPLLMNGIDYLVRGVVKGYVGEKDGISLLKTGSGLFATPPEYEPPLATFSDEEGVWFNEQTSEGNRKSRWRLLEVRLLKKHSMRCSW